MTERPIHLYLLERKERAGYDEMAGCVVAATSEAEARNDAAGNSGDEGGGTWRDENRTSCVLIAAAATPEVSAGLVLCNFRTT